MASQVLVSIVTVTNLAGGEIVVLPHGLKQADVGVTPIFILPDRGTNIAALSADNTNVVFRNESDTLEPIVKFRCEYGLSMEVDHAAPPVMYYKGGSSGTTGSTVTFGDLGLVNVIGGPYAIPFGTPVAFVGGTLVPSDAALPATVPCIGIYTGPVNNRVRVNGPAVLAGLPADSQLYLAEGGGFTSTPPTGAGKVVQGLGQSVGTGDLFVSIGTPIYLS